jgi:acetate kinase
VTSTEAPVLALNSGSSSLKFGVFMQRGGDARATYRGSIDGIGAKQGHLQIRSADGASLVNEPHQLESQAEAIGSVGSSLARLNLPPLAAIGHRIVHGGPGLREHQRLTPDVLQKLQAAASFAPLHVPVALTLIREAESQYPGVPQFVCFDTAFHRTLPEVASRFPLAQEFWDFGIQRYGFHGISCESIVHALGSDLPARAVIAHLGNGASITAVSNGHSVDTSMGLTPTGGIIMGTRSGDLDPGVLLHLRRNANLDIDQLEELLDKRSGLLGISGLSSDMRELHQAAGDPRAQLAVAMFARTAAKTIASYSAVLAGVDSLVFSGGIGEHDSVVRSKICEPLAFLGLSLDPDRNAQNQPVISHADSRVSVRIVPADEEIQIARHVFRLLSQSP